MRKSNISRLLGNLLLECRGLIYRALRPLSCARRSPSCARRCDLIILLGLSLIVRAAIAAVVTGPGYPDAAYYFDVAKNLVSGHGFTEDFIISYLTPAQSVVHPSNFFWMPLTSIVIAPFMALLGTSWLVAQIPIVLLTASLPLLAYWIGWDIFRSRRYALAMAFFTLFGGSLYPFYFAVTDSFALYGWVSILALVGMYQGWRGHPWRFALAGIAIGLAHLTRADGVLLLGVGCFVWLCSQKKSNPSSSKPLWKSSDATQLHPIPWQALLGMVCFYLLTMVPWFLRNMALVGSPLPLGGTTTIWLTSFSDFFSFRKTISSHTYLSWGLGNILSSKVEALGENLTLLTAVFYIPIPFAILGMWTERKRAELLPFLIYLLLLYSVLSLIFTFPSIQGTFFHSLVALIPLLHGWSIVGMDITIDYVSKRFGKGKGFVGFFRTRRGEEKLRFSPTIPPKNGDLLCLGIAMAAAVFILGGTVFSMSTDWNYNEMLYQKVGKIVASDFKENSKLAVPPLGDDSIQPVVMVAEAADYYYATGQHAVLLPTQTLSIVLDAAQRYSVSYILFTPNQGQEERRLFRQTTLTDSRLKLIWTSPSGKLYRL